jgi:hypothetical protein
MWAIRLDRPPAKVLVLGLCISVGALLPTSFARNVGHSEFVVATAKSAWHLDLSRVECVSLVPNRATIFAKDFFEDRRILDIIQAVWPEKRFYRDNSDCPYVFVFTILSGLTRAVKYRGRPSVASMAFQVCARKADKTINPNSCSYKNIYLFEPISNELDAFEIGIKAFALSQSEEWLVTKVNVEGIGRRQ